MSSVSGHRPPGGAPGIAGILLAESDLETGDPRGVSRGASLVVALDAPQRPGRPKPL